MHTHFKYLIVGGGMTADAAVRGIRELDAGGSIALISVEVDAPYSRPPLTKALWKGEPLDSIWLKTADADVELRLGRRVTGLDLDGKRATDDRGATIGFDKLLLATGGTPRRLPFGGDQVIHFRTLDDYKRVHGLAAERKSFAVVGGGFIGSEISAALAMSGCKVTLLFPETGIGARIFPLDLSLNLVEYFRNKGVDVRAGETLSGSSRSGARIIIDTKSGLRRAVDVVVAGVGIAPNADLAKAAGLAVDDGIIVNEHLATSHPDVFAAGDVARFTDPVRGKRIRVEHEDNAVTMGRAAGRAMAGEVAPYMHQSFFYSDLFELGYEAVGEFDPAGETVSDWKEPFREGVVYYLTSGRVRGVLLWNTWQQVDAARALIAEPGPFRAADLIGRLTTPSGPPAALPRPLWTPSGGPSTIGSGRPGTSTA